jgi:DNA modification methylase
MNHSPYFLKLRANINLDGDVHLAERELRAFFRSFVPVNKAEDFPASWGSVKTFLHYTRFGNPIGFIASDTSLELDALVLKLNFFQEIWKEYIPEFDSNISSKSWATTIQHSDRTFIVAIPLLSAAELLSKSTNRHRLSVSGVVSYLAKRYDSNTVQLSDFAVRSPSSTPHVHSLHKYKAKFFPRLIRSFIVTHLDSLPPNANGELLLLDPFVGSGTALVEASVLGIKSVGVDIDPLSCAISKAKLDTLSISPTVVAEQLQLLFDQPPPNGNSNLCHKYSFPNIIARKFTRWDNSTEMNSFETEISHWRSTISEIPSPEFRDLAEICLSDALTRKFNIRMMGTGVGRFALEISQPSVTSMTRTNLLLLQRITAVTKALKDAYNVSPAPSNVIAGSATKLDFSDNSFSLVLTSPPYLPASSGRENYLVGKAISITALNLMTAEELESAEQRSVGSMKAVDTPNGDQLPDSVHSLCKWLRADSTRYIKADPIFNYYVSLKQALRETFRVLVPGGLAIYVIGKQSVFYTFRTREVLYRVECDKIFAELATQCGFSISEQFDVELDKKNKNARPRGLDSYFESVFVLCKPS